MPASASSNSVANFGVFEADLRSGELRKCGVKIKIQELPFQALKLLLTHPNEVLSRDDLRRALWPDGVYVDFDRGVISTINRLRDTLGDSAENPAFIETVGRRGYRWIAPTHNSAPPPDTKLEPSVTEIEDQAPPTSARAPYGKLLLLLPALALLVAMAIFWANRVSSRRSPSFSSGILGSGPQARNAASREAEEFYLQGRYYWEKRTPESLNKAVDAFTQAVVHDPAYAPAYVGLADCYNLLREYTVMPASEAYPRALAAAKKATELDPQSSEAHASLAFASFYGMWNVVTADREFRRAIELSPNNAVAHHWYATYLAALRRYDEAIAEIERAQALDPASKSVLADKGSVLFNSGRRKEATDLLKQMEESEPDFISPHRYLKFIYLISGDYPAYLQEARKEAVLMHDDASLAVVEATEKGYTARGGKGLLEALSREQRKLHERGQFSPFFLAGTYSLMNDRQEAMRYLRIACEQRVDGVISLESDHAFDNLESEPSYRKLLADLGLPPIH